LTARQPVAGRDAAAPKSAAPFCFIVSKQRIVYSIRHIGTI
jgi:hypothetical protein